MSNVVNVHKPVASIRIEYKVPFPSVEEILVEDKVFSVPEELSPQEEEVIMQPVEVPEGVETVTSVETIPDVDIAALCAEARQEGYEAGFRDGKMHAETEFQQRVEEIRTNELLPSITQFGMLAASLNQQWKLLGKKLDEAVVTLALTVARQILKAELSANSSGIIAQVQEALRHITGVERLRVRVHPEDEKLLKQYRGELLAATDAVREIIFEVDEHISRGGCIIESEAGNVDATIETQLKKMTDLLMEDHE